MADSSGQCVVAIVFLGFVIGQKSYTCVGGHRTFQYIGFRQLYKGPYV